MKKCWAEKLGDCKGKITNEHIVTKALSEEELTISGFSWLKGESKKICLQDLCSHILCKKHNNDLSNFDTEIVKFKNILKEISLQEKRFTQPGFGFRKSKIPIRYTVNGHFLEKWFCKTLVNVVKLHPEYNSIEYNEILPYIYGNKNFEEPYGLYVDVTVGSILYEDKFFSILPIFNSVNELSGANFIFHGINFRLQIPTANFLIEKLGVDRFVNDFDINGNIIKRQLNWHNRAIRYEFKKIVMQKINFKW